MRDHGIYLISRLVKCGFTQSDAADNRWDELEDYTHGNELFCRYNPQSCRKKRRRLHGVLSKRSDQDGETAFAGLALQGCLMGDMPSAAGARGAYLREKGFARCGGRERAASEHSRAP